MFSAMCAFVPVLALHGQVNPVELHTAEVVAARHDLSAFASFTPDSLVMVALPGSSAGELLAAGSTLNLRQYGGYGSLITGASRGLSADHFAVSWNGMPIHSASLGLTDLSSIPLGIVAASRAQAGALTSDLSAGAAAGRLHLDSESKTGLLIGSGYDNLLNLRNWAAIAVEPAAGVQIASRFQRDRAQNRFRYNDPLMAGNPERSHEHNAFDRDAWMTEVHLTPSNRLKISSALWLQRSALELPELLGSHGESFDVQRDSLIRISGNVHYSVKSGLFDLAVGRSAEAQRFTSRHSADAAPAIDSRITALRNFAKFSYANAYKGFSYKLAATLNDETARSAAHPSGSRRLLYGASFFGNLIMGGWMGEAAFRIDGGPNAAIPVPELRLGRRFKDGMLMLQARRVFRYPDLNELFWTPGGNPNLEPEDGLSVDLGWKQSISNRSITADYSVTIYRQAMEQLIVWTTGREGLQALNFRQVQSTGVNLRGELKHAFVKNGHLRYTLDVNAQHNEGLSELESRFFPKLQSRAGLAYLKGRGFVGFALRYVADAWKPEYLNTVKGVQDAVLMADAIAGIQLRINTTELAISAVVQNMGNVMDYRVSPFATPGTVASLRLHWKFIDQPIQLYKPTTL